MTWPAWLFFLSVMACGTTDFLRHYVPNYITLPLLAAGLLYHILTGDWQVALIGAAVCFALGSILFALGGMGGGDVKLMAAIGAWTGLYKALEIIFVASVIGAVWGLGKLARQGILKQRLLYLVRGLYLSVFGGVKGALVLEKIPDDIEAPIPVNAIPFGACLAASLWVLTLLKI